MMRMEVVNWMDELSANHLMCRDLGHAWDPHDAWYDSENQQYRRVLMCRRCETKRSQWVSRLGVLSRNSYTYPKGYQAPGGVGRLTAEDRAAIRLTAFAEV